MYIAMSSDIRTALLVVDVQKDFCAGGALAVPEGDRVVDPINRLLAAYAATGSLIFASRDWHPVSSSHFSGQGGHWPVHCVAGSDGAAFHPRLRLPAATAVVSKGQAPESDGYSAFDGTLPGGEPLQAALDARNIGRLTVCGLATDYCVRASALDARTRGLQVSVVRDAIAAVNLRPGDETAALREMEAAGAGLVTLDQALALVGGTPD
jgi:nicotinamidase/pyrazinamidase